MCFIRVDDEVNVRERVKNIGRTGQKLMVVEKDQEKKKCNVNKKKTKNTQSKLIMKMCFKCCNYKSVNTPFLGAGWTKGLPKHTYRPLRCLDIPFSLSLREHVGNLKSNALMLQYII